MKILLITTTYPTPRRPRQGAFNRVMVEAISARHDVRVIAPVAWTQVPWTRSPFSKPSGSGGKDPLHPIFFYPPKILREQYHHFYWLSIRASLWRLEQQFTPDLVLGYWLHPDGDAAVRAAARYGVPAIVMSGGTDLRLLPRQPRRCGAIKRVLVNADRLIVFGRELAAQAHQLGVPANKVDIIYRGVNRECFYSMDQTETRKTCRLASDSVVIFWAGRFEQIKNPTLLLQAAVRWKHQWGDRLRVIMAGDGPLRGHLHQLRRQLDLEQSVQFAGNLKQSELALRYNAADVTVLTSHSEGVPNVLLESIACGTPFVATDVGGVSEIADRQLDRLVSPADVNELAGAVIDSIHHRSLARRAFVPSDLAEMADRFDAAIGAQPERCCHRRRTPHAA